MFARHAATELCVTLVEVYVYDACLGTSMRHAISSKDGSTVARRRSMITAKRHLWEGLTPLSYASARWRSLSHTRQARMHLSSQGRLSFDVHVKCLIRVKLFVDAVRCLRSAL